MNSNHARNWQQHVTRPEVERDKKIVVKVRKKSWLTKGEKIIYASLCTMGLAFGIFIVSYSSSIDTLNRDVQSIEADIQQQESKNDTLVNEIRDLSKAERITGIAKEHGLQLQDTQVKRVSN